jgi:multicomponent Na+:H+ antiporter subunit B
LEFAVDIILLMFLAASAIAILRLSNLFAMAMMFSLFSLLSAGLFTVVDAADVAFTEAAVGAGISTLLMLATLTQTSRTSSGEGVRAPTVPLLVVIITGAAMLYGTQDLPTLGDPDAPIHTHVANRYLEESGTEIGVPNVVTSVLASHRGYDTLGETTVIFTAGVAVLGLLGIRRRRDRKEDRECFTMSFSGSSRRS